MASVWMTTDTAAQGEDINLIDPSDVASPAQHGKAVLFVQNTAVTIPHGVILVPTAWISSARPTT